MTDRRTIAGAILVTALALAIAAVAAVLLATPAHATITGDSPPSYGDWVINTATKATDEPGIYIEGNIIINSKLTLTNSTVLIVLWTDGQYMVNVTDTGELVMEKGSTLTSFDSYYEYGFLVTGKANIRDSKIQETYKGVRVITDKAVTIQDSVLEKSMGTALYLENANGTKVIDSTIQTSEGSTEGYAEFESTAYGQYTIYVSGGGMGMYIKGGTPTIDGLDVSVNGTYTANVKLVDRYYYAYYYTYVSCPLIGIDSKDISVVSGINVRDSTVNFKTVFALWGYSIYGQSNYYIYHYAGASAINIINYGDAELKECTAKNVNVGSLSTSYYAAGGTSYYYYVYFYANQKQGMKLYGATITEKPTTAGPHNYRLTIRNGEFSGVGVLGYSMSPNYGGTVSPTFHSEIILDNIKINGGSYPFTFTTSPAFSMLKTFQNEFHITNSTFTNMTGPICQRAASAGPGTSPNIRTFEMYETLHFDNCLFRWNRVSSNGLFYEYDTSRYNEYNNVYDRWVEVSNSKFLDHSGRIAYIYWNYYTTRGNEGVNFYDNYFYNCTGSDYLMWLYYCDRLYFNGNTIDSCPYPYGIRFYDQGGDYNGKKPDVLQMNNNTIKASPFPGTSDYDKGVFAITHGGDLEVMGNKVRDVQVCFVNMYEETRYAGYADIVFRENDIQYCNGSALNMANSYDDHVNCHAWVENNTASNNNGPFVTYRSDSNVENADYDATMYFRYNTIVGTNGSVFNNYGYLIITDNVFKDCKGYVINAQYLYLHPPVIKNNVITNCRDVYLIGAKNKGILKMTITIKDLYVDCTGNAFYFKNIDATLERITVTDNATVAIIAEDSNVDCVSSQIPLASGEVIGDGSITVWFNLEVFVFWSNATAPNVTSGQPVSEALVVFYGQNGVYYLSDYTEANGHLRSMRMPQWNIRGSFTTIWTPMRITVAKNGITMSRDIDVNMDYVGEDAFTFLLADTYVPRILITSPFPGDVFALENLTLRGFTTEVGSGVKKVQSYFTDQDGNDLPAVPLDVDSNGDFANTFTAMPEGTNILMHAEVWDIALNYNHTTVTIVIDRTPPTLQVTDPTDGDIKSAALIHILGTYEAGAKISINGLERQGPYTGILNEEFTLSEGSNAIVVEAEDLAGNVATVVLTIHLDRFAPTLTVLEPRDGLVTKVTNITIEGEVESDADITVSVRSSTTNLVDEVITPRDDGTFSHKVDLAEGENTIVVRAWDRARNLAEVTRVVIVDTTEPLCEITSPKDGTTTNQNTIRVTGKAELGMTLYLNGKQIFNDGTVDRIVNLNEGPNPIELRVVDAIGNAGRHRITVTLDTKAPTITMTRPLVDYLKTNVGQIEVGGTVTGVVNTLTVMGQDVSVTGDPADFSAMVTLPSEGLIDVIIEAMDRAGNRVTHTIQVDYSTAKPMLNVVYNPSITDIKSDLSNLYITGTTTPGIAEVTVSHTSKDGTITNTYPVDEAGMFTIVRILKEGDNTFSITVTDSYGNDAETSPYLVKYTYKEAGGGGGPGSEIDPGAISGIILAISIALLVTVVFVTRTFRARKK